MVKNKHIDNLLIVRNYLNVFTNKSKILEDFIDGYDSLMEDYDYWIREDIDKDLPIIYHKVYNIEGADYMLSIELYRDLEQSIRIKLDDLGLNFSSRNNTDLDFSLRESLASGNEIEPSILSSIRSKDIKNFRRELTDSIIESSERWYNNPIESFLEDIRDFKFSNKELSIKENNHDYIISFVSKGIDIINAKLPQVISKKTDLSIVLEELDKLINYLL